MKSVTLSDLGNKKQRSSNSLYKFLWRVPVMPTIQGVAEPVSGSYELPPLNVEALTLPLPTQNVVDAQIAAATLFFADKSAIEQFNMVVKEDDMLTSLKYFTAWNHNIQNPYTGGFYLPSRYKKNIEVFLFNSQGEVVMSVWLKGVWPTNIENFELDNTDDKHKLNISMSVDAVIPKFHK